MRAERAIKYQSRLLLSQDNWGKAVAAFIFLICGALVSQVISGVSALISSDELQQVSAAPLEHMPALTAFLLIQLLSVFVLFAFSPMFLGYIDLNNCIAKGDETDFSAIFGWFSDTRRYLKAVMFCLMLAVKYIMWAVLCFAPAIIGVVLMRAVPQAGDYFSQTGYMGVSIVLCVLIVLGVTAWLFATSGYFLAPYIFTEENQELSAKGCIDRSILLMKNHRSKYIKLIVSFLPWFLLCFLVIPALYVIPYFQASCAVSARWMKETV